MSILKLNADEIDQFTENAAEFHERLRLPGEFNGDAFCVQWRKLVDGGIGHIWAQMVNGRCAQAIGLLIHPDPNTGDKVAAVMFWYLDHEPGNMGARLFLSMLRYCEDNRVASIYVHARLGYRFLTMNKFLTTLGFTPVEACYRKELNG